MVCLFKTSVFFMTLRLICGYYEQFVHHDVKDKYTSLFYQLRMKKI